MVTPNPTRAAIADPIAAALARLEDLMCGVAGGALPGRGDATAYSQTRAEIMAAPVAPPLPGFVHQCLTVFKFRDFITLYDPDPDVRESFIHRAFARCREARDDFEAPAPVPARASQRWRF